MGRSFALTATAPLSRSVAGPLCVRAMSTRELPIEEDFKQRLMDKYHNPSVLDVQNQGNSCGAAKIAVMMVSDKFQGMSRINRQRAVQSLVKPELDSGLIHALSMVLRTPEEHAKVTGS